MSLMRFFLCLLASMGGIASVAYAAFCWVMVNTYFRPVHFALKSQEGDPYAIAVQCGQSLASDLLSAFSVFAVCGIVLLLTIVSALLPPEAESVTSSLDKPARR